MLDGEVGFLGDLVQRHGLVVANAVFFDDLLDQRVDLGHRQVQTFGFSTNGFGFAGVDFAVFEHAQQIGFQGFTLFDQLVAVRRRQQGRRDGKDTDAQQGQDDGHRATNGCDGRNVAITHRRQRDHRPVNGRGDVFELVGLRVVLEQVTQTRGQHHQQHHDEG